MMGLYTLGLAVLAMLTLSLLVMGRTDNVQSLGFSLLGLFLIGNLVSAFVANGLMMARPTR
jgi:hypothetical protein